MTLQIPQLDDRRFQDIVDEAKRLIPRYCPEWTSHNLSDPGVALIEIFAWMTEMMLYRINHVPDALYERFLGLMGLRLHPPAAARADISFFLSGAVDEEVTVPQGTEVATQRTEFEQSVVFVTDTDVVIRQPDLVAIHSSRSDREVVDQTDLLGSGGTEASVFPSLTPGLGLYIGFREPLNSNILEVVITARTEGIGIVAEDPPWRWEASTNDGWVAVDVRDTTGGFNHDGTVRVTMPSQHDLATLHGDGAFWLRCVMTETDTPYTSSPVLRTMRVRSRGCVSSAHHAELIAGEELGRSDGTPGQAFESRLSPVLPRRPGETVVVRSGGEDVEWLEVDDFGASTEPDRHFTWDSASGRVRFGPRIRQPDGSVVQHGAIPPAGATVTVSRYRFGGGSVGNVGPGRLNVLKSSIPLIGRVTNEHRAEGGVDGETIENAKLRGPMTLRAGERAVTAADFERLTLDASREVARVRALAPETPGGPVRVLVVPRVGASARDLVVDDLAIPPRLHRTLAGHLDRRRVLTSTVEIREPLWQGVTVIATVRGAPGAGTGTDGAADAVREAALDALYGYINPFEGGPKGRGWPFDRTLTIGELFTVLAEVDGVVGVENVELFLADPRTGERGRERQTARLPIDALFLSYQHAVWVQ
jgi:predicted phage baseplate assembly protein